MSLVEEIKARLDIVDVIGAYVPLKRSGKNYKALCPFHEEKTPSFIVFPETQTWHCFGACNTGGDVFTFIMKREGVDFPTALRMLAERAGLSLEDERGTEDATARLRQRLYEMHAAAAAYYQDILHRHPQGEAARAYLRERGLNAATIAAFQLGYALPERQALLTYLRGLGFQDDELVEGGLVIRREDGRMYDRFRGRVIIPIHDAQGRVVAFAGRVLGKGEPKYLNSPQTPIFDKGRLLYGYPQAVSAIRQRGEAIIVEGYMDVLSAHQAGFRNVVASMGTALTSTQMRLLARHARRIVLALDADAAGLKAALRGVEVARESLSGEVEPMVTPTGAVRFTATLDVDLRLLRLPSGLDPDDLIRQDPKAWQRLVDEALPVLDFYLQYLQETLDLNTARGKAEAVRQMAPLLLEVANATERDHYIQRLARLLQVDERALAQDILRWAEPSKRSRREATPSPRPEAPTATASAADLEAYLMQLLLRWPQVLPRLGDRLQRLGQPEFHLEELYDVRHRVLLQVLLTRLIDGNLSEDENVLDDVDADIRDYIHALRERANALPDMGEALAEQEVLATLLRLRLRRAREVAYQMRYLMEEAEAQGDEPLLLTYGVQLGNHLRTIRQLERLLPVVMLGY